MGAANVASRWPELPKAQASNVRVERVRAASLRVFVSVTDSQAQRWKDLGQGLYQHLDVMLEWRITHRQARGKPGFEDRHPSADTLVWERVQCLGGLSCTLYARFLPSDDAPQERTLRLLEFRVHSTQPTEHLFAGIKTHLERLLGAPSLEYDGTEGQLRSFAEWESERILLLWKVVGGTRQGCVGEMWSKPLPKEYLKLTLA